MTVPSGTRTPAPAAVKRRSLAKRAMDLTLTVLVLPLLLPLSGVVAVWVGIRMGRPILFRQTRIGRYGRPFPLVKFRTMTDSRGPDGALLSDGERLTPLGRFLRRTSLDELPTLWNVLRGEMSLVGPRPLLPQYMERYTPEQARRHDVPPGVTGWAQIHGRNAVDWVERFELDLWYVDHWSLRLDLSVLLRTVGLVVRGSGVHAEGEATMREFQGSREERSR